jgi:hypothetical protein
LATSNFISREIFPKAAKLPSIEPVISGTWGSRSLSKWKCIHCNVLDVLDREENPNSYKVDQLIAMRWARTAWRNMNSTIIQNCWRHTGLLIEMEVRMEVDIESKVMIEPQVQEDYNRLIVQTDIKDAISIEEFLNPVEEEKALEEMEMMEDEEYLLATACNIQENTEQETVQSDIDALYDNLSKEEEIKALAMAIAVYERRENSVSKVIDVVTVLREVQRKIRREHSEEQAIENREKLVQRSIRNYVKGGRSEAEVDWRQWKIN